MRRRSRDKENIAPRARTDQGSNTAQDRREPEGVENDDGFIEIGSGSANHQIEQSTTLNLGSTPTTTTDRGKDVDRTEEGQDMEMADASKDGTGSTESLIDLDDIDLDELLEIEKENPDDLGPLDTPDRQHPALEGRSSRGPPLSEIDPRDLPAPLKVKKSSYFSKEKPMEADSQFEEVPDDLDLWFEEGEVDEDGIRREEVEVSRADWHLERHPRFGKYRVRAASCLRVSWTIDDYTAS